MMSKEINVILSIFFYWIRIQGFGEFSPHLNIFTSVALFVVIVIFKAAVSIFPHDFLCLALLREL